MLNSTKHDIFLFNASVNSAFLTGCEYMKAFFKTSVSLLLHLIITTELPVDWSRVE